MRSADDIRRVLLAHENDAPDGTGLVEAALAGAVRVRRRRRLARAAVAAVVALVVPVTVIAFFRVTGGERADPATPPAPTPLYRDPLQVTVEVDPASGYTVLERQARRDRQLVTLRPPGNAPDVTVVVHDPGTFDPARLKTGRLMNESNGRVLHFYDPELQGRPTRAVGWAEPSGAWVVATTTGSPDLTDLQDVAAAIRTGPPRDLRTPYRLGYVPQGFVGVYVALQEPPWPLNSVFALDPDPAVPVTGLDPTTGTAGGTSVALTIRVTPMTGYVEDHISDLGPPTKVAGLNTFYLTESTAGWSVEPGSAVFVVSNGLCPVFMNVRERDRVAYEELVRIVENATFTDCGDLATWTGPLK